MEMKRVISIAVVIVMWVVVPVAAQGFDADPVFSVKLLPDRVPAVAGQDLRLFVPHESDVLIARAGSARQSTSAPSTQRPAGSLTSSSRSCMPRSISTVKRAWPLVC